jgi:hypothetical protein
MVYSKVAVAKNLNRAVAILFARLVLGLIFFMPAS